ncbi:MAG: SRPBCC domain-containing protein [Coriobacteriia bacterium]
MDTSTSLHETIFTEPSDNEVTATRIFDAPRDVMWAAFTDPAYVPLWLTGSEGWTMPVCEIDLRPGGAWHWVWAGPQGEGMEMHGEYLQVQAPERLVNTENWGDDWPETINTLELTEENGVTATVSTVRFPSSEAREKARATGMEEGWADSYNRLDSQLRSTIEG